MINGTVHPSSFCRPELSSLSQRRRVVSASIVEGLLHTRMGIGENVSATSHDVARAAGVSQGTVSRALRGMPGMTDRTRDRVLRSARALNYVPSETGRSLRTRQTRTIGVVSADLTNPFYPQLIEPIRAELDALGFRAVLIPDSPDSPVGVDRLSGRSVDGIIVTTALLGSSLPHDLRARSIPFVLVNREVDGAVGDTCIVDNRGGAVLVADLLVDLGHRRIGAIFGPSDTSTGRDRELALREQLGEHGITVPARYVRRGPFSYTTGRTAMHELLEGRTPPTAVFCGNDVIALGACNAAAARGIRVGPELTVIGFDDIEMASWDVFQITTVGCDLGTMARTAVELLIKRIAEPDSAVQRVVLQPKLVKRSSHHPVPGR